jgi:hypothetical protein
LQPERTVTLQESKRKPFSYLCLLIDIEFQNIILFKILWVYNASSVKLLYCLIENLTQSTLQQWSGGIYGAHDARTASQKA